MTEILTIKKIRNKARAMRLREQRFQRFLDEKKKSKGTYCTVDNAK